MLQIKKMTLLWFLFFYKLKHIIGIKLTFELVDLSTFSAVQKWLWSLLNRVTSLPMLIYCIFPFHQSAVFELFQFVKLNCSRSANGGVFAKCKQCITADISWFHCSRKQPAGKYNSSAAKRRLSESCHNNFIQAKPSVRAEHQDLRTKCLLSDKLCYFCVSVSLSLDAHSASCVQLTSNAFIFSNRACV